MSRLGGLPLAITIAGAFMRETGTSIQKFLQYYQESWHALQMRARPDRYYQGNLLQTWLVSYNEIQKRDAHVAELKLLLAHFDNRDIWYELVKCVEHSSQSPVWFDDVVPDALTFRDNIRTLSQFSLIEVNQLSDSYSIHPVIQDWCLDMARNNNDGLSSPWHELALVAVGTMVPSTYERDYWQLQRRLLVHADFMWQGLKSGLLSADTSVWYALLQLGNLYFDQGKLKEAETMYQRALAGYEKAVDPDHMPILDTINNLDVLYSNQRKLKETETIYQQALAGYKKAIDPDHISTLDTVNNLGILYYHQGKLKEAETIYQRALADKEKTVGPDHTSTLNTVNSLSPLYEDQGKLKEAETMYQQALAGYEKAYGPDNHKTKEFAATLTKLSRKQRHRVARLFHRK
jgi:tetratricopeptide (TPR) repeat protein